MDYLERIFNKNGLINKNGLLNKVLINVLLITTFIMIFFFTYGIYIEKKVVVNQMDFLSSNITETLKIFGADVNKNINDKINNITIPDFTEINKVINNNNKTIISKIIKIYSIFGSVIIGMLLINYKLNTNSNLIELKEIILESFIILLFLALVEYSFLTFFSLKFISIDPNKTKLSILKNLKKYNYI